MAGPWEQYGAPAAAAPGPWANYAPAAQATAAAPDAPEDPLVKRGSLLPVGRTVSGQMVLAAPEWLHGPLTTISDVLSGNRRVEDLGGREAFELGSLFAGLGPMTRFPAAAGAAKAVSEVTAAGARIGVDVPRSVGSEGTLTTALAKILNGVPFGGTPQRKAAGEALDQLQTAAAGVKDAFGSSSAASAGKTVAEGLTGFADKGGTLDRNVGAAYEAVDKLVKPEVSGPMPATAKAAQEITDKRAGAGIATPSQAAGLILEAATRPEGLTYEGIKTLRTFIGEKLKNPQALASGDISEGELKGIYKALTDDMRGVVRNAGGDKAVAAWEAANTLAAQSAETRETLAKVLRSDPSDEGIFSRIEAMTGSGARADAATLGQVREAVGDQGWGDVMSALVERWGFDEQGAFDPKKFMTKWGKVSTEAKDVLFKTAAEKAQAKALDDIATVSTKADALRVSAEPKAGGTIKGALGLAGASALVGVTLNPLQAVVPIIGARVVSNVLAKPQGAPAFALWAKAYEQFVATPNQGTRVVLQKAATALAYRISVSEGIKDAGAVSELQRRLANSPLDQAEQQRRGLGDVLSRSNEA